MYLEHICSPADVRAPPRLRPARAHSEIAREEIRSAIVRSTAVTGGHTGSNLASVELTIALHRVFETPRDKIVFDVSHQTYAHKMLTGRARRPTPTPRATGSSPASPVPPSLRTTSSPWATPPPR